MMKNKKLLVAMLSIACACACTFAFSSCDAFPSGKSEQNYERQEGTLSLENSIFNVRVGVKGFVVPTGYIAVEGKYLSFESSDKTVVSVNQYGEFTAIKEGSANIIVKYGEATATAIVNVSWDGENPRLRMNKEIEDSGVLKLSGLEAFDLGLWVYYNANAWKDATYEYIVSDPTVGCVEDGEFIPLKNGTTSVTVKATWREKTCPTMEKTFTVMVGDEVELSVNDGLGGMIKLYTKENVGDKSFSVSSPFVITANKMVDGEKFPLQTSVNISEGGEAIVEYDQTNDLIRSKGIAGTANIIVSCELNGTIYTATSTVVVDVSIGDYETTEPIEFSALDGTFFKEGNVLSISEIFKDETNVVLTSATADEEQLHIDENNAVLGLKTPNKEVLQTTLTLLTSSVGYHIPVTAYTKIIDEASDLDEFCLDVTDYGKTVTPRSVEGYYVLAKDIDASKYKMQTQGYLINESEANLGGFKGVFDGRGYTISDITFGCDLQLPAGTRNYWNNNDYSLFGILGGSAVVKNFALTGVKYDLSNTGGGGDINMAVCSPIGSWILSGATVENVYISVKSANRLATAFTKIHGFGHQVKLGANLKNIIIDDSYTVTDGDGLADASDATYKSSFSYRREALSTSTENKWSNIIVISKNRLTTTTVMTSAFDASNVTLGADSVYFNMPNTYRYETISEFISASANYAEFGGVWDKSGFVPVWKGLDLLKYLVIELGEQKGDAFAINGSTTQEVAVSVSVNGQEGVTLNSVTIDGDCVTYAEGKLIVNCPGEATVIANVTYEGQQYDLTATVNVTCEIEDYAKTVEFSAWHGTLPMADIFGDENAEIVLAYQGNTKLEVKDNKISGLTLSNDKADEIVLTVYSKTKGYNVTCNAYSGIISTAADLEMFNLNMTNYTKMAEIKNAGGAWDGNITKELTPLITGYYVLNGDIDASDYAMQTQGYISGSFNTFMDDLGFKGTFDGRGYTISGLTFGYDMKLPSETRTYWNNNNYSLFGIISKGGTVKNFALTDVKFDLSNTVGGDINMSSTSPIAMWVLNGAKVENVYVSVESYNRFAPAFSKISGFAYCVDIGATLSNIVIDDTYTGTDTATYRGSLVYRKMANQATTENNWKNVVVISKFKLATAETNKYDASNVTSEGYAQMPNTYRYESVMAWETVQADANVTVKPSVDMFTNYWYTVNGVPVWGKETV